MGYLQIASSSIANFSKAVISLWFRVPADTLAAGIAASIPGSTAGDGWNGAGCTPPLVRIIPLITFGSLEDTLSGSGFGGHQCSPSFIGIDCNGLVSGGGLSITGKTSPTVAVNLQTPVSCSFSKAPQAPQNELRPECYYMQGIGDNPSGGGALQTLFATADVWHHILVSFDIGHGCSITWANSDRAVLDGAYDFSAASTFSWAFDDVSKTGFSMSPSQANVYTYGTALPHIDSNLIIPQGLFTMNTAGDVTLPGGAPTDFGITVAGSSIASVGNAIGIPTSATLVDNVYQIEMAELQLFTGVSIDAGNVTNRRFFVTSDGKPQPVSVAAAGLGVAPQICLSGTSAKWIAGTNTGTGGNLTRTGTITGYTPGPGLT